MSGNPERKAARLNDLRAVIAKYEPHSSPNDPNLAQVDGIEIPEHIEYPFWNDWAETYVRIVKDVLAEQES
ncbi:MAG TPA: hypothetical protein PKU95_03590 [Candidatus Dojkabacteria bacterium]|nr:hypothetical protein [Candidatus Dojkabacteria bacterium]